MKTILVPTGGATSDATVFATALAAARPLGAHLSFLHVHVGAGQAAVNLPHAGFASGIGLLNTLDQLKAVADVRSAAAAEHVRNFCSEAAIALSDTAAPSSAVTASWHEERDDAPTRIMFHARHHDLVVVGRANRPNGLPADFLELLVLGCGRPVLIASTNPPKRMTGTAMVCWKESADAARAVTAAMPLLQKTERVVFVSIAEYNGGIDEALQNLVRTFQRAGVVCEGKLIEPNRQAPQDQLAAAAAAYGADLLVMGAYSRARMREVLFGGCTQAFIQKADLPVLMLH